MSERFKVIVAYTLICVIWGSTWLAIKIGLETIPPFLAAGLRFVVACGVLFTIIKVRKVPIPLTADSIKFFIVVTLTSFSVPFGLVYWGEQKISSGLTSVIFAVFPFCVALFSVLLLPHERLNTAKSIGILLGFSGIVTIFSRDISFSGEGVYYGMSAVLLSGVLQGFSAVWIKKYGHDISPFVVSFVPMAMGAMLLLITSYFTEEFSLSVFTPASIGSIIYLAVFGTVTTFVSYFWLIKRVEVVFLSLTAFVTPIIAVILGVLYYNEHVTTDLFIGAALVLCGILTANFPDLRKLILRRIRS